MATTHLTNTSIDFTSDGTNVNASLIASAPDILTLFSTNGAQNTVVLENARSIELVGTTSGNGLTHQANAITAAYSLTWPAAQSTGTQILTNDGAGNLSWTTESTNASAGNLGDIQYSDGTGGFLASTTSIFNYTDGTVSQLEVGVNNGTFQILGTNGTTDEGTNIEILAGNGGSGAVDGGSVSLTAGNQLAGTGNAGAIDLTAGNTTGTGSTLTVGGGSTTGLGGAVSMTGGNTAASATVGAQFNIQGGQAASGGSLDLIAGDGNVAGPGGDLNFTCGDGTSPGEYLFNPAGNTAGPAIVSIQGASEAATSDTTGTVRITNGLGVTGTVWANELTTDTDLNLNGATSGTLTMHAAGTTTNYTLIWPNAQAAGVRVLENDGAGNLSWGTAPAGSAGNLGDIQYSNGAGGFLAATTTSLNFSETTSGLLLVGAEDESFDLVGVAGTTLAGSNIGITGGEGGSGSVDGGSVTIAGGEQSAGTGDGGSVLVQPGTGTTNNGMIRFIAADTTTEVFCRTESSTNSAVVEFWSEPENATTATTGSIRVVDGGGIGVDGNVYSGASVHAETSVVLHGSTSGTFTQEAAATTTNYTVTWPDAQAASPGQVLSNDSTGVLSWEDAAAAAGVLGDVQLSDGSGGFIDAGDLPGAPTPYTLRFINTAPGFADLFIGEEGNGYSRIYPPDASTGGGSVTGSTLEIISGKGFNQGNGGQLLLTSGQGGSGGVARSGAVIITSGNPTTAGRTGDVTVRSANNTSGPTGALELQSGGANSSFSGAVSLQSGGGVTSGTLTLNSGNASGGSSGSFTMSSGTGTTATGAISMSSGNASNGSSGNVSIASGSSAGTGSTRSSGNVTISTGNGTSADAESGDITLQIGTSAAGAPGQVIFKGGATASSNVGFVFQDAASSNCVAILSGTQNATTTSTGTVRITGGLGVTQDIYANTVNVTSDVHQKESLELYGDNDDAYYNDRFLHKFLKLKVYQYKLKSTGAPSLGILAHDLQSLFPNTKGLVTVDPNTNEPTAVNYNALLMVIIEVLQQWMNTCSERALLKTKFFDNIPTL